MTAMARIIHILVVEDDWVDQMEIKRTLEKRGILHRVTLACTGEEALTKLETFDTSDLPDIILLDLNLPRMSGLQVHKRLQDHEEWKKIKTFVLTGATGRDESTLR